MSDKERRVRSYCSDREVVGGAETADSSGNLRAAYLGSPLGPGLREQIRRARALTPAFGLRKAARVAVAASMLLAGRGTGATS